MKKILSLMLPICFAQISIAQVQIQASIAPEELGINTLIQTNLTKNQKVNYFGHTNFEVKYKNDTTGKAEFFNVVDYKLFKYGGLALGNSINKGDIQPEIGFSIGYEYKAFNFNVYPTVNYSLRTQAVGYGANGQISFEPKLNKNWNFYNLLIFGMDIDAESKLKSNNHLLAGFEYKKRLDFGFSMNLANQNSETQTDFGVFVGYKLFENPRKKGASSGAVSNTIIQHSPTEILYTMPSEETPHEGTWLNWPHHHQFGTEYRDRLDATWAAMTQALQANEKVHIVAYDATEQDRITAVLKAANVPMTNIEFRQYKTDDVWARDVAPIYVTDKDGKQVIEDWGFNGWGKKFAYDNCNTLPTKIGTEIEVSQQKTVVNLDKTMILEGGSVEIDGEGTMLLTKSAVLNSNRNPKMTQAQAEAILTKYYGVTNIIWLDGVAGLEITDMHIDGFAKFANGTTLITMSQADLAEWEVPEEDIDNLYAVKNKNGLAYSIVQIPLTQKTVTTTYGKDLGHKGSYINFYVANGVVLVPNYNDPNDAIANAQIQVLYPTRKVIGIDVRNLYANGGMVHCVTQQQPK